MDTNCDPDEANYVIPGNDDAIRSCSLVVRAVANGIEAGRQKVPQPEAASPVEAPPAEEAEPEAAPAAESEPGQETAAEEGAE